ncbi:MAG: excinuclease ABC subunit UvrC [Deltaproteobacteria bacterium]|nr:excinuclease ABC subunit UvrC [Deltaproteobacteria bacterium]NIS76432.1 excinuclease ABC subunit UvrC [Deltaproteobacteria bacterium]
MSSLDISMVPAKTGIYLFKDKRGKTLYVGKAKNIRARLRSYQSPGSDSRQRILYLMREAATVEFFLTTSEREALLLENNLIKKHRPPYNVYFRDDKEYLCLRIDLKEQFPRFQLVRKVAKDGALYLGPYESAKRIRHLLGIAIKLFPMRTCSDACLKGREGPCMQFQIKRCPAPCVGLISEEEYRENIQRALKFFRGDYKAVRAELRKKMREYAKKLRYEEAAEVRDRLRVIEDLSASQSVVNAALPDTDVFGVYREEDRAAVAILFLRNCRVMDVRCYTLSTGGASDGELIDSVLSQYYGDGSYLPAEIVVPLKPGDAFIGASLSDGAGEAVDLRVPLRGKRRELMNLAAENAKAYFEARRKGELQYGELMERMVERLKLEKRPVLVECYDVSHHSGDSAVGALVTFEHGTPKKGRYRKFKIKQDGGRDDYTMISEILGRRIRRGIDFGRFPDLIVIDGGKGHLMAALKAIGEAPERADIVSIAKERGSKGEGKDDRVYIRGRKNPLKLKSDDPVLLFLKRVRDEAHRFALSFHRSRDEKSKLVSIMNNFPGIGRVRVKKLMDSYGSVREILDRPPAEVASLLKISPSKAADFLAYLTKEYPPSSN